MAIYEFELSTSCVGSEVKEEVEINTDGMTAEEEEIEVAQCYIEWVGENNYGGWSRKDG